MECYIYSPPPSGSLQPSPTSQITATVERRIFLKLTRGQLYSIYNNNNTHTFHKYINDEESFRIVSIERTQPVLYMQNVECLPQLFKMLLITSPPTTECNKVVYMQSNVYIICVCTYGRTMVDDHHTWVQVWPMQ